MPKNSKIACTTEPGSPVGLLQKQDGPSLVVVGTGIQWAGQTTLAAQRAIARADSVLFAVADPWTARFIRSLSPKAESFAYPRDGRPRRHIYEEMVARILRELQCGRNVCAAFYGSPAVLTFPAHEAIRRARDEGFAARMLPGVSSLDCLFADLGVDPGDHGCQIFEAGHFLASRSVVDPRAHLVLCQIALINNHQTFDQADGARVRAGLAQLGQRLSQLFSPEHHGVIYEAAVHPLAKSRADRVRLADLANIKAGEISTLYVPPLGPAAIDEPISPFFLAPSSVSHRRRAST